MNGKERVCLAFAREVPDRVPINYEANAGIDSRLKAHFGLKADDHEGLRRALHVDFRGVQPRYTGPVLHEGDSSRNVVADIWGVRRTWVEHPSGGYWDYCDFPLRDADEEAVAAWPMPSPDDFDYSDIAERCEGLASHAVFTGGPGQGDIINKGGMLRGTEQTLLDVALGEPAGMLLARRRVDIQLEVLRRTFEAAEGGIDFLWMGEDLGTQRAPLISLAHYRAHVRPFHEEFAALADSFDVPVMIHSCGSSSWAYGDFVEMGIAVVDTLQPEATDMAPEYLKAIYGDRLAFHGCISTAGPVAFGGVDDVVSDCRRTLEVMMPGGGYCFAPTHQLQDNSPTENVVAMYETAFRDGVYG